MIKDASPPLVEEVRCREIERRLLAWFDRAKRDLPWRGCGDPYAIWVSEIMLQQTTVAAVIPYWERFMARFPTLEALASAPEEDVLSAWSGLGYYSRARNLQAGARTVLERFGGVVPRDPAVLRALPGIGPYTAGAIASIAYGVRAPLLDGNVMRVLSRVFRLHGDPTRGPLHRRLWTLADTLVPADRPGDFNQALMELGATVCTPLRPRCDDCPLAPGCEGRAADEQEALPQLPKERADVVIEMVAAVVWRGDRLLLVQRPPGEWWAGLWSLPVGRVAAGESREEAVRRIVRAAAGLEVRVGGRIGVVKHGVTHHRITLTGYHCPDVTGEPTADENIALRWAPVEEALALGPPAPQVRLLKTILARSAESREEAQGSLALE